MDLRKVPTFLLVAACVSAPTSAHPVVAVIKMHSYPPIMLSSGVILNERYILTVQSPVNAYPYNALGVLPATNLAALTKKVVDAFTYQVVQIFYPSRMRTLLVVLLLERDIFFYYGVNPATIPLARFEYDLDKDCQEFIFLPDKKRDDGFHVMESLAIPLLGTRKLTMILQANQSTAMDGSFLFQIDDANRPRKRMVYCTYFNGLPFICNYKVLGLLVFTPERCHRAKSLGYSRKCLTTCAATSAAFYVNLMHGYAQLFVRKFILGAKPFLDDVMPKSVKH